MRPLFPDPARAARQDPPPAAQQEAPREGAATFAEPCPAGKAGRHVAWLDDEESLVFLARRMLEKLGFRVTTFLRGEEAVAAVRAAPGAFDALVSDHNMPGMSGIQVALAIRGFDPHLPLLLVSGCVTPELEAEARKAGFVRVLEKPDSMGALCRAVEGVLRPEPGA